MTGPSPDGYYDLTFGPDNFTVPINAIALSPLGVRALDGNDTVVGSVGGDRINGNKGDDSLSGGAGNDPLIQGGRDNDVINGDSGDDVLNGNLGTDYVRGGAGNDNVRGGQGTDVLTGDDGNDVLYGDLGIDLVAGNEGSDTFALRADAPGTENLDIILDFDAATDSLGLNAGVGEANLTFSAAQLDLAVLLDSSFGLLPPDLSLPGGLNPGDVALTPELIRQAIALGTGVDIDPDGDNQISGTFVRLASGGDLAFVLGAASADLAGQFVPI